MNTVLLYFVYSFFNPRPLLWKMLGDDLKIFVRGLPLDCEEHSLKDFLEGKIYAKEGHKNIFWQIISASSKGWYEWAL